MRSEKPENGAEPAMARAFVLRTPYLAIIDVQRLLDDAAGE